MLASHWVNPSLFRPLPRGERDIDLVMVAAWGKYKRHHVLFRALREMPKQLNVQLVGQDQEGRTADTIRAEAASYGVEDRFGLTANASYEQVVETLCRAKASVLLSLQEGSAVVVAESLFADTPVALLENAQIGSRAFINESTGMLLRRRDLAGQLMQFLARSDLFRPRMWAERHISCSQSTDRLNRILEQHALGDGQSWTGDIFPLCWRPDPRLVHREHWQELSAERAEFRSRYGLEVGPWE
jgi:glycosyltransferase involved in cell wall biosynthesis